MTMPTDEDRQQLAVLLAEAEKFQDAEDGTDEYPDATYMLEHVTDVLNKVVNGS